MHLLIMVASTALGLSPPASSPKGDVPPAQAALVSKITHECLIEEAALIDQVEADGGIPIYRFKGPDNVEVEVNRLDYLREAARQCAYERLSKEPLIQEYLRGLPAARSN